MKRMLINATQEEELRMAMVDGQRLYDLNIEAPASERKKANIYLGKITRIEPSLEAAFVDYGAERHGFLPLKEISPEYFSKGGNNSGKPNIKDVLSEGQPIVVQVDKEERGNKGAALTTFVSLAGRFIVLKPNKARSGGVSRRITGADRDNARKSLNEVIVPDGMSVILRTAGIDRSAEELAWDLENLLTVWEAIRNVILERPAPFLIYRESDSVVRALRDYLTNDIGEILIDDEQTWKDACEHVEATMPHNLKKLKHYTDPVPLFTRFQIETQIESAFAHNVNLPSGGSIVIDHTEALVSIDINSARATKGGDIEATALNTNLEAADEIARQLRIRDLGGLVVIDFIDMGPQKHQREVENRLREAVRQDRARVQIGKISRFGLLEMSRQRLRPSIGESAYQTCPRCTGFGTIRGTESLALAILRIVGEEARKERTAKVIAQLPVEVATYLLNEKRDWVQNLEDQNDTQVVLVANPHMETPHYDVRRVRDDQTDLPENAGVSYSLADAPPEPESPQAILERKGAEVAVVGTLKPSKPAPKRKKESKGLLATIAGLFGGSDDDDKKKQQSRKKNSRGNRGRSGQQQSRRRGDSRKSGGNQQRKQQNKKPQQQKQKPQRGKQARKDDGQQGKKKQNTKAQQNQAERSEEQKNEQKRTRSRRSRGGRRRRRGGERNEQAAANDKTQQQSTTNDQPQAQPKQDAEPKGPPKARTDAERAADAAKVNGTAPQKAPADDKPKAEKKPRPPRKPKSESKPSEPNPKAAAKPEPKAQTEPKEKPEAKAKSEAKAKQEPKAEAESRAKPESKPKPEKPATKDAAPAPVKKGKSDADSKPVAKDKPGNRLLPWEPQEPAGKPSGGEAPSQD